MIRFWLAVASGTRSAVNVVPVQRSRASVQAHPTAHGFERLFGWQAAAGQIGSNPWPLSTSIQPIPFHGPTHAGLVDAVARNRSTRSVRSVTAVGS